MTLSVMAGLSAACGADDADEKKAGGAGATAGTSGAAPAAGGGTGSPGAAGNGGGVSTEEMCTKVQAILDNEKMNFANVGFRLATANMDNDEAEKAKAKTEADALIARLTKAVGAETAKAADPKARAAIDGFIATVAKLLTLEAIDDPDYEQKLDAAGEDAAKYCPAIKE
ncbi:MAG TPA: hypothetical protein VL738_19220 [Dactylosporangium sp.]|nr:hypothetical protein [Dactylosporangium sp.]